MKKTINEHWVSELAEELICEIIQQMSGIDLKGVPNTENLCPSQDLGAVYGETVGDFNLQMQFKAEEPFFMRLAQNMTGYPIENREEMEEYATEFFNIICGRFVSELYNLTGQSARFLPTVYQRQPNITALDNGDGCNTVTFNSDHDEAAVFCWMVAAQEQI